MRRGVQAPGVMPRAINDLFKIAKASDDMNWKFSLTYVEIYNERIKDLLNPSHADLDVRECPKRGNVRRAPAQHLIVGLSPYPSVPPRLSPHLISSCRCNRRWWRVRWRSA